MTGTTEQAPQSDITGPIAGNGAANGAPEAHQPVLAGPALEDLDGIEADALLQDGRTGTAQSSPSLALASSRCRCLSGAATATHRQPIPFAPI